MLLDFAANGEIVRVDVDVAVFRVSLASGLRSVERINYDLWYSLVREDNNQLRELLMIQQFL
jgi:hypothetical protein